MLKIKKKETLSTDNYLLNKRHNARRRNKFTTHKHRIFLLALALGLLIITAVYFISPYSNVFSVAITGNHYFDDDFYEELSQVSDDSKYLLTIPVLVENRIKSDPLVESANVELLDNRVVKITVKEKEVVAYTYDSEPYLILKDGSKVAYDEKYLSILSYIPYLEGYSEDDLKIVIKGFEKLNTKMIDEISEIHRYPFSYDDKMMEVIMRDGNYVYLSYYALPLLNNYHAIVSELNHPEKVNCIYIDEMSNGAYTSACPFWEDEDKADASEDLEDETPANDEKATNE